MNIMCFANHKSTVILIFIEPTASSIMNNHDLLSLIDREDIDVMYGDFVCPTSITSMHWCAFAYLCYGVAHSQVGLFP